jgi:tetratricopeptide (TPR) repeat protein
MRTESPETRAKLNGIMAEANFGALHAEADRMVESEPSSYIGYWWRGRALTLMGRLDDAVRAFYESVKHADDDLEESRIMASLTNVFNVQKKHDIAEEYAEIALELNPGNPVGVLALCVALASTGRRREASELISANWGKLTEGYEKACAYAVTGQKSKLLEALREDLAANPHHRVTALHDPEFRSYLRDPEFRVVIKTS